MEGCKDGFGYLAFGRDSSEAEGLQGSWQMSDVADEKIIPVPKYDLPKNARVILTSV